MSMKVIVREDGVRRILPIGTDASGRPLLPPELDEHIQKGRVPSIVGPTFQDATLPSGCRFIGCIFLGRIEFTGTLDIHIERCQIGASGIPETTLTHRGWLCTQFTRAQNTTFNWAGKEAGKKTRPDARDTESVGAATHRMSEFVNCTMTTIGHPTGGGRRYTYALAVLDTCKIEGLAVPHSHFHVVKAMPLVSKMRPTESTNRSALEAAHLAKCDLDAMYKVLTPDELEGVPKTTLAIAMSVLKFISHEGTWEFSPAAISTHAARIITKTGRGGRVAAYLYWKYCGMSARQSCGTSVQELMHKIHGTLARDGGSIAELLAYVRRETNPFSRPENDEEYEELAEAIASKEKTENE